MPSATVADVAVIFAVAPFLTPVWAGSGSTWKRVLDYAPPPYLALFGVTTMVGGAVSDGHLFGCSSLRHDAVHGYHDVDATGRLFVGALCPLLVWPFAAPLDVRTNDLLKLCPFGTTQSAGARIPDRRRSDGLCHGERADQHAGNAARCRMGVGLLQRGTHPSPTSRAA